MTIFYNPNTQKYKESESVVLNLEILSIRYQNLLIQYKQSVADYINFLNNPDNKNILSSIPGQAFWGTGQAGIQAAYNNILDVNSCSALCSSTANCTGATFNPTKFATPMCWLRTGDGSPVPSDKADNAIMLKSKLLLINMQNINNQLLSVNKQIIDKIASTSNSIYGQQYNERSKNAVVLLDNYKKVNDERIKIDKIVRQYEDLDQTQNEGSLMTNANYYSFLLLFALVIVFLIILIRYSYPNTNTSSNGYLFQKGGELKMNIYYIIFILILLIISIYYIWFISDYINIRQFIINIITSIHNFIYYGSRI
jgi:hypothetical protein